MKDATKTKYEQALQLLSRELRRSGTRWESLSESEQDLYLAEWLVEGYEEGARRTEYGFLLSALSRIHPRVRYKTAWKVFEVWGRLQPPQQAAAAPPELITAMMVVSFALCRPELALIICLCFSGLLRVGEALNLKWRDVIPGSNHVTLCLGQTKTGMEHKVILTHQTVRAWVACSAASLGSIDDESYVFTMSYSSVLRWVKKLSALLAGEQLKMTTHSFRRSGASELSRRGMPIADICLFGRWLSDRSAREYIRKGEVAILRSRGQVDDSLRVNWDRWSKMLSHVWNLQTHLKQAGLSSITHSRVTEASFRNLERLLFQIFDV